ncbi:MAG TPA: lipopolysaccharide biosynthesis protein [Gemmatimonadaceae bacterium]
MRLQLVWTVVTELLVTISGILVLKFAAALLGPVGFGEYSLSRRAVGLLYLPLVLGFGVAAPRYIAIARAGAMEGFTESAFATATLTAGLVPPFTIALLLNAAPEFGGLVLFGSRSLSHLVPPATIALAGIALHAMVYAVYRGRSEMKFANTMQSIDLAIVPVIAFLISPHDAAAVLTATGVGWLIVSGIALGHVLYRESREWRGLVSMRRHLDVLLKFGLPRVPGEFALVGLFAIPSLLAVRAHGVVEAGQFSAALSVLTMAAGTFAPVGLVVLPRASAQFATGDLPGIRHLVLRILGGGILLAALGVAVGEVLIPPFIRWYFGEAFLPAVPYFRTVLLGTIPYAVYILMRSILDALDVKALNSRNLIITLAAAVILCLVNRSLIWMSSAIVASLVLLGALTLRDVYARLRLSPADQPAAIPA